MQSADDAIRIFGRKAVEAALARSAKSCRHSKYGKPDCTRLLERAADLVLEGLPLQTALRTCLAEAGSAAQFHSATAALQGLRRRFISQRAELHLNAYKRRAQRRETIEIPLPEAIRRIAAAGQNVRKTIEDFREIAAACQRRWSEIRDCVQPLTSFIGQLSIGDGGQLTDDKIHS